MYLSHFGLHTAPFALTPDTAFAFASRSQREALETLVLALDSGEGFIKITGEVGTGKTLLCRRLLAHLGDADGAPHYQTAYVPNPCISPRSLLLAIARELRIRLGASAGAAMLDTMNRALLRIAASGKRVVVCLDEAQSMPRDTLEALRLLSNLETETHKLLQVVLFGQPELDRALSREDLRQLRSRIAFQYRLSAMCRSETEVYLAHRLHLAGYRGAPLFTPEAAAAIHRCTRGVPRVVNIVAHKALLLAYGQGGNQVTWRQVRTAVKDTPQADGSWLLTLGLPRWLQAGAGS